MRGRQAQRHPLRHAGGVIRPPACSTSNWRPVARTRSGCTSPPCTIRAAGDLTYGADPTLAKKLGLERQWLHARSLAFAHPADGRRVEITSPYPADLQHALDVLRDHAGGGQWPTSGAVRGCCSERAPTSGGDCARDSSCSCCPPARRRYWPTASCGARCSLLVLLAVVGRLGDLRRLSARSWLQLLAASAFISLNWGTYIWAVTHGHVVDAALGYFVNPLVTVALGVVIFRERLNRWQLLALVLAVVSVVILTAEVGDVPYVALILALSFSFYGADQEGGRRRSAGERHGGDAVGAARRRRLHDLARGVPSGPFRQLRGGSRRAADAGGAGDRDPAAAFRRGLTTAAVGHPRPAVLSQPRTADGVGSVRSGTNRCRSADGSASR